jgi:TolA-binding protein
MTTVEARKARASVAELRARMDTLEDVDGEHAKQIPELSRALEQAQALLVASADDTAAKENKAEADIADLGARLDQLPETLARGTRERAEARDRVAKRLAALEQTDTLLVEKLALTLPEDKEQLWRQATALLASGQREQGRRYFQVFIQRFPQDSRASQGLLSIGVSYADEARFPNAAATFQRLLATYPDSPDAPEAMWQLSRAFGQMSFCKDERTLLRNLVERYPRSRPAVDATKALNSLKRSSDACVS